MRNGEIQTYLLKLLVTEAHSECCVQTVFYISFIFSLAALLQVKLQGFLRNVDSAPDDSVFLKSLNVQNFR